MNKKIFFIIKKITLRFFNNMAGLDVSTLEVLVSQGFDVNNISADDAQKLQDANLVSLVTKTGKTVKVGDKILQVPGFLHLSIPVAILSQTVKNQYEDFGGPEGNKIVSPLMKTPFDTAKNVFTFAKMFNDYMTKNEAKLTEEAAATKSEKKEVDYKNIELEQWELDFFNKLIRPADGDKGDLFNFLLAANFLDMELPLHRGSKMVAKLIEGKQPEEIRAAFQIAPDRQAAIEAESD